MSGSTFLQIHGGGDSSTRMIELPIGPVRIGRGGHCEVRLGDPGLVDVQCILRRRGNNWHFQPVGPPGQVWIDGRAADHQRTIHLGVPFRVGDHWLTLRPADSAINDWGTFDTPIAVEPEAPPIDPPARDHARSKSVDEEDRLRRWEARLDQRERMLKDRQEERRWEARWKSAGESIRTRSTPPATPLPTPSTPPPASALKMPTRPTQTPPVARIIEPRAAEPIRRVTDSAVRPSPSRHVLRPRSESHGPPRVVDRPERLPSNLPVVARIEPPVAPVSRALVMLAESPVTVQPCSVEPPNPVRQAPESPEWVVSSERSDTTRVETSPADLVEARPEDPTLIDDQALDLSLSCPAIRPPLPKGEGSWPFGRRSGGGTISGRTGRATPLEPIDRIEENQTSSPVAEPFTTETAGSSLEGGSNDFADVATLLESPGWLEQRPQVGDGEPPVVEIAARPVERPASPIEFPRIGRSGSRVQDRDDSAGPATAQWPSASAIFAAQRDRPRPDREASPTERRKPSGPEPTDILGPSCWTIPLWFGWLPVLLVSVSAGLGGMALSCDWAIEASNANIAIRLATRPEGSPGSIIDPSLLPRGGWWSSTSTHLSAWAVALQRAADGEDHSEEIRSMIDSARQASPLSSRSRFLVEDAERPGSEPQAGFSGLGRTRDVVTLTWTGRRLRKEGKVDSAIRAYRSAMEIASKASLDDLDPPVFFEDRQVRRYALPRESMIGLVARSMAEDGDWTLEQWTEALPDSAASMVVASRVLSKLQKRVEADRLADLAIRRADSAPNPDFDPAEERAAAAEALAYRGRWTDAAEQYRLAIDLVEDDATRRMWWLNLAEVAQRVGDDPGRARAIEAAKAPDSVDQITRRALEYQKSLPGLASSSPRR